LELAGLLRKLSEKKLTEKQVRERLRGEETSSEEPLSDEKEISEIAEKILEEEKKAVADYAKGKPKALDFLVGQLVKKRECDARVARKIIEEKLLE
jgi:Asp-tRNA(Asn)/Glu-tRNA(Gln) amidotransferase B subunit